MSAAFQVLAPIFLVKVIELIYGQEEAAYVHFWGVQEQGQFFTVSMVFLMLAPLVMALVMGFMFCQEDAKILPRFTFLIVLGFVLGVLVLVLLELFPLGALLTELAVKALF